MEASHAIKVVKLKMIFSVASSECIGRCRNCHVLTDGSTRVLNFKEFANFENSARSAGKILGNIYP